MVQTKDKISILYKLLLVIVCGVGLYLNFDFISFKSGVVYFTLQSNMLCFVFFAGLTLYLLFNTKSNKANTDRKAYYIFKGLVTTNILLTMSIYTMLAITDNVSAYDGHFVPCLFVHYITPIMVLLDYVFFDKKGGFKGYYPVIWSIVPVLYGIFNLIYTLSGGQFYEGKYAYAFLNFDRFDLEGVFINCLLIYIYFILIGYIIIWFDRKVGDSK